MDETKATERTDATEMTSGDEEVGVMSIDELFSALGLGGRGAMPHLGRYPFVALEFEPREKDGQATGYAIHLTAGGGIPNRETMAALLLEAAAGINEAPLDVFVALAEKARKAAGLRSLTEFAFTDEPDEDEAPSEPAADATEDLKD